MTEKSAVLKLLKEIRDEMQSIAEEISAMQVRTCILTTRLIESVRLLKDLKDWIEISDPKTLEELDELLKEVDELWSERQNPTEEPKKTA